MYTAKINIPRNAIAVRILPSTKRRSWRLILCCTLRWKSRWKLAPRHCSIVLAKYQVRGLRSWFLSQRVLQHVPCAVQTYCHVVFRNAQHFRHLCVRQAFKHQHDHLPVSHGQRLNGRHKPQRAGRFAPPAPPDAAADQSAGRTLRSPPAADAPAVASIHG